jgi:CRP-like cAMP-binding protein
LKTVEILSAPHLVEAGIAVPIDYAANQLIIAEGSQDRHLFLIETGRVRVTGRVALDENRHIQPGLCDLGPGEVFGELSLFEQGPRSASVVAVEDSRLLRFDAQPLADYFDQHPHLGYVVLKALFVVLTTRLRTADRRLESLFAWGLKVHGIDRHL